MNEDLEYIARDPLTDLDISLEGIMEGMSIVESLYSLQGLVNKDSSEASINLYNITLESLISRLPEELSTRYRTITLSLENNISTEISLSTEGIGDVIEEIWTAIINTFKLIYESVFRFFDDQNSLTEDSATELRSILNKSLNTNDEIKNMTTPPPVRFIRTDLSIVFDTPGILVAEKDYYSNFVVNIIRSLEAFSPYLAKFEDSFNFLDKKIESFLKSENITDDKVYVSGGTGVYSKEEIKETANEKFSNILTELEEKYDSNLFSSLGGSFRKATSTDDIGDFGDTMRQSSYLLEGFTRNGVILVIKSENRITPRLLVKKTSKRESGKLIELRTLDAKRLLFLGKQTTNLMDKVESVSSLFKSFIENSYRTTLSCSNNLKKVQQIITTSNSPKGKGIIKDKVTKLVFLELKIHLRDISKVLSELRSVGILIKDQLDHTKKLYQVLEEKSVNNYKANNK